MLRSLSLCRSSTLANCDDEFYDVGNRNHHGSTFPGDGMSSTCRCFAMCKSSIIIFPTSA